MQDSEFEQLSPPELAVFWLASDPHPSEVSKVKFISSFPTLILAAFLAEGFVALRGDIPLERVLSAIEEHSREMVTATSYGPYVRYDHPVRNLLKRLLSVGFPVPTASTDVQQGHDAVTDSYEYGANAVIQAIKSLEAKGLIVDPPWYKKAGVGALILLIGSIPLEVNIKTNQGSEMMKTLSIRSKLWSYESVVSKDGTETHINFRAAEFVDRCVEKMAHSFIESWRETNPDRVKRLTDTQKQGKP